MQHVLADAFAIRVYYEDTDFSGRVYHASYLRFLERGRTEWLRARGFTQRDFAQESGVIFAVRSIRIDYRSPALMDDLLKVETAAAAVRGASIEFKQRISRDQRELVAAKVLVAAIRDGRPTRIPPALRSRFEAPRSGEDPRPSVTGPHRERSVAIQGVAGRLAFVWTASPGLRPGGRNDG